MFRAKDQLYIVILKCQYAFSHLYYPYIYINHRSAQRHLKHLNGNHNMYDVRAGCGVELWYFPCERPNTIGRGFSTRRVKWINYVSSCIECTQLNPSSSLLRRTTRPTLPIIIKSLLRPEKVREREIAQPTHAMFVYNLRRRHPNLSSQYSIYFSLMKHYEHLRITSSIQSTCIIYL